VGSDLTVNAKPKIDTYNGKAFTKTKKIGYLEYKLYGFIAIKLSRT